MKSKEKSNSSEERFPMTELSCEACHLRFSEFQQTGLLGCPKCYISFAKNLDSILIQVHGSSKHIGSRPTNRRKEFDVRKLDQLRQQLQQAIAHQDFEKAAEFRDLIRDIERQLK
ncbi:UvrB/UvrC motif-containing protein [candidate division KSB1 bacterium]|nr:UvrB/UvrC motif-containing protein [candidate division KSB1 bacterium]